MKKVIVALVIFVIVSALLAFMLPQARGKAAQAEVERAVETAVQLADVEVLTVIDGQMFIPQSWDLPPEEIAELAEDFASQQAIVHVADTAITSIQKTATQMSWAGAVGDLADNAWIVMVCIVGAILLFQKAKSA